MGVERQETLILQVQQLASAHRRFALWARIAGFAAGIAAGFVFGFWWALVPIAAAHWLIWQRRRHMQWSIEALLLAPEPGASGPSIRAQMLAIRPLEQDSAEDEAPYISRSRRAE